VTGTWQAVVVADRVGGPSWPAVLDALRSAADATAERIWVRCLGSNGALALVAAAARRIPGSRLGAVIGVGQLAASVLAKQLTSTDVISGGRLDVALEVQAGQGGHASEVIDVLRGLAGGQPLDYRGRYECAAGARCHPPACQPGGVPLWIWGPELPELAELAGESADGWIITQSSPQGEARSAQWEALLEQTRGAADRAGRPAPALGRLGPMDQATYGVSRLDVEQISSAR
jgi:alkanesulfonate monooxygenase SsuD/methylene tetrahydromethanopterin reductase-like flavin-dependent oxidoreductase (luciferase family)